MSYVVQPGDTLGAIAGRHGTTVASLLRDNPSISDPNRILPGQRLAVPARASAPVRAAQSATTYTVRPGDTLSKIASDNGTTVGQIMSANPQISNPNRLSVGQNIRVPSARGGGNSGGRAGGSSGGRAGGGGASGGSGGGGSGTSVTAPQPSATRPQGTEAAPRADAPITSPSGTWVLPTQGQGLKLVLADFSNAARELACETAAVRAVAEVESGGRSGFDDQKRPKILFEVHKFRKHTGQRYDQSHPHLSAPYKSPRRRESYRKNQWQVIREAFALAPEAAVKSASWGMFQVLGENHAMCGWRSVRSFVEDMYISEAQHMRAFIGFCRSRGLLRHLKTKNWAAFAEGYNGPDYASNNYHTKMADAYRRYSR
ncbi:N-acetylmuramidase domain-containing protein [Chondromyces crocatus]|uniref:LysM domain-containing protein n=1 Tax=Chondromyces crocatus TaxID=52 RepID=A0A0K1ECC1_CHOCO|nr:N-acetylmuramidase domain-containing protein [Chondromyces crocatus]AKT38531.1 uncharacterized protein CMC5_026780 [Chondromyces crocatus]